VAGPPFSRCQEWFCNRHGVISGQGSVSCNNLIKACSWHQPDFTWRQIIVLAQCPSDRLPIDVDLLVARIAAALSRGFRFFAINIRQLPSLGPDQRLSQFLAREFAGWNGILPPLLADGRQTQHRFVGLFLPLLLLGCLFFWAPLL